MPTTEKREVDLVGLVRQSAQDVRKLRAAYVDLTKVAVTKLREGVVVPDGLAIAVKDAKQVFEDTTAVVDRLGKILADDRAFGDLQLTDVGFGR